ncbi:MAG: hypothetical protein E7649_01485 [Ruminococcaceae bacterium]|nr:hypothetical protein [Oscillospiraceae bacterium]
MNGTAKLMIDLIRQALDKSFAFAANSISDAELEELYRLSKAHDVAHLVACSLERNGALPDSDTGKKLHKQMMLAAYRYEGQAYELARVCDLLEREKIDHIVLKGSVTRKLYPEPWMRTMSDIDILVKAEMAEGAKRALVHELGYKLLEEGSHDVSLMSEGGVHVELHHSLTDEETGAAIGDKASEMLLGVWDNAQRAGETTVRYSLSCEFFYFYHVAHAAKHIKNGGCGIKPFIDLYLLDANGQEHADDRRRLLERAGLYTFGESMSRLSQVWFGGAKPDSISLELEQYVLCGGVYGTTENKISISQGKKGKLGYALSRVFLPYDILKYRYPVLQKHKWLTPVFEVVRWFGLLFCGGVKRSAAELKLNASITEEQAQRAKRLMNDIGL